MTDTPTPTEPAPEQTEMPFAYVQGEAVTTLPKDLYIPPDALEVFLEAFEGPLDLLLYLIRRQNLDVLDVPIAEITRQYMEYIDLMQDLRLELAAEYLVMAAMLAEIKSRMLLPRPVEVEDEDDPRAELIRRLQEYERYKQVAEDIDHLPRVGRDLFPVSVEAPEKQVVRKPPEISLQELLMAARRPSPAQTCFPTTMFKWNRCPCVSVCHGCWIALVKLNLPPSAVCSRLKKGAWAWWSRCWRYWN